MRTDFTIHFKIDHTSELQYEHKQYFEDNMQRSPETCAAVATVASYRCSFEEVKKV